jgi:hypothetical protein
MWNLSWRFSDKEEFMGTENNIIAGRALPGAGVSINAPMYDYTKIFGRPAELLPAGEHIRLDALLPRRGTLTKQLALDDWGTDWLVLHFDEPLEYDNASHSYVLIRARWIGVPIGEEFCPVFVLFDRDGVLAAQDRWESADFQFESWGQVRVIDE